MNKTISFGIPCYNSAEYMDHCISSILEGSNYAEDIEIIVVDDGSTKDNTLEIAQGWEEKYPNIVKAVHQENGGHGMAVLKGLEHAQGVYYKVVDSDDWLDKNALQLLIMQLRHFIKVGTRVDLVISNYVYEHVEDNKQKVVDYKSCVPTNQIIGWDDMGHFGLKQYLLMHSLCYRTDVLRKANLPMPAHTFYVDNIYAYVPLPLVKTIYYMDIDLYRYFIGRDDQSVNEEVLTSRIDHYWRVSRIMMDSYHIYDDVSSRRLASYMMNYFTIIMAITSVFSRLSDRDDAMEQCDKIWDELRAYDKKMYMHARKGVIGLASNLPGHVGQKATIGIYKISQKLMKFN